MRALVISGGGNKGAFAGGIAEYLIKELKYKYDLFLGTSTGSLLLPLLSVGKINEIKKVFTNVTQDSIFNSNPFIYYKNKYGKTDARINHLSIVRMFMKNKKTLGESENLRKLIKQSFSLSDFKALNSSNKKVVVSVANLSRSQVEYKQSDKCHYLDFCDWVWASSNLVPFMSLVHKNGCDYADGGFGIFIPIKKAIEMGAIEIDAIVLRTQEKSKEIISTGNVLELFLNSFSFMINQIATDNIDIANCAGRDNRIKINYYYIPNELSKNVLVFDPIQLSQWWNDGFEYAAQNNPLVLDSRRKIFTLFG